VTQSTEPYPPVLSSGLLTVPSELMTHVLAFETVVFGTGSGAPNRHEHWWSVRQCAPTYPTSHTPQSMSVVQSRLQSALAVHGIPVLPVVQAPPVQVPVPLHVKVVGLQFPDPAALVTQWPCALEQFRMLPVSAFVAATSVSVVPLQLATLLMYTPMSGTLAGSATVSPAPPK